MIAGADSDVSRAAYPEQGENPGPQGAGTFATRGIRRYVRDSLPGTMSAVY